MKTLSIMKIYILFFYNILLLLSKVPAQQYLDDNCFTSSNENGQCTYFEECSSAMTNLMRGIPPKICGYEGAKSIVCCVNANSTPAPIPPPVTTEKVTPKPSVEDNSNIRLKMVFNSTNKRLCQQKCDEYAQYVYKRTPSFTFLPGEEDEVTNTCGALDVELIIGGIPAKSREFPHMALVGFTNGNKISWNCGGSLISERYILTAGHCLYHRQFGEAKHIRLGDLNYVDSTDDAFVQQFTIIEHIAHPQYAPPAQYHDIALLKLNQTITFNEYVRPACLQLDKKIVNTKAIASGWGVTEFGGDGSDALMQVTLDLFSYIQCNKTYKATTKLIRGLDDDVHLCAGSKTAEKDSCQGDSGGPLQLLSKEVYCMYNIIGITSFGKACGYVNIPGVYTRVSNYLDWIEGIVWAKH